MFSICSLIFCYTTINIWSPFWFWSLFPRILTETNQKDVGFVVRELLPLVLFCLGDGAGGTCVESKYLLRVGYVNIANIGVFVAD